MLRKTDLVNKLSEKTGKSKSECESTLNVVLGILEDACVEDGGFQITGVFTVERKLRKGRECVNPKTGEKMLTEDKYTLAIKTGKTLKDKLNG